MYQANLEYRTSYLNVMLRGTMLQRFRCLGAVAIAIASLVLWTHGYKTGGMTFVVTQSSAVRALYMALTYCSSSTSYPGGYYPGINGTPL